MNKVTAPYALVAFFTFMNLFTNNALSDIIVYAVIFFAGIIVKSRIQWGKTNSDALETLTADYRAIKELFNAKIDEVRRKNEQLIQQGKEILELRARVRSYENFLETRPPEADKVLTQLEPILLAMAEKLQVPFEKKPYEAHPAAHSQADKHKGL